MLDPVAVPDLPVDAAPIPPLPEAFPAPAIECVSVDWSVEARTLPRFDRPLEVSVRQASLLTSAPWVRGLGKLPMEVNTQGWRFPLPPDAQAPSAARGAHKPQAPARGAHKPQARAGCPQAPSASAGWAPNVVSAEAESETPETLLFPQPAESAEEAQVKRPVKTRLKPPADLAMFKDRLLYLLQPPLEDIFAGKQDPSALQAVPLPDTRHRLPDAAPCRPHRRRDGPGQNGPGHRGLAAAVSRGRDPARALVVCPKPLVINWSRELRTWAEDIPFEVVSGDTQTRRATWYVSNCPLKLVNYELLTRDADELADPKRPVRRRGARRGPAHQEPATPRRPRRCARFAAPAAGP